MILCLGSSLAGAQTPLATERFVSGLSSPTWVGAPAGDDRIFVAEQRGHIEVVRDGVVVDTYLDLTGSLSGGNHHGILGMAFHPDYFSNGYAYVVYSRNNGDTVVSRWTRSQANPNVAEIGSELEILVVPQPDHGHDGGAIAFGPHDGYMYLGFGDGNDDVACNSQRMDNLLGKILRIDVDNGTPYSIPSGNPFAGTPGARAEIFHYGLRQPWRMTFDAQTGDLFIGDIGEDEREEISFARSTDVGINFGWPVLEGTNCVSLQSCPGSTPSCAQMLGLANYNAPIYELFQSAPGNPRSIVSGFVYRGCSIPTLQGTYFFADYYDDIIRSLEYDVSTGTVNNFQDRTAELMPRGGQSIEGMSSFGVDGFGEVLIVDHADGEIFKVIPANAAEAGVNLRNGLGVNDVCYTNISPAIIGNVWKVRVDVTGHPGATFVSLQARRDPANGTFFKGTEILVGGPAYYKTTRASTGSFDRFELPIPCDLSLNGATAYTQTFILGGAGLELCNALDVTVGYY